MNKIIIFLAIMVGCEGCLSFSGFHRVTFSYFNLSAIEIWVTEIEGLPSDVTPGRLSSVQGEDQLSEKSSSIPAVVQVPDKFKILWKENGKEGWPGGLKVLGSIPPGVGHQFDFNRDELGIPKRFKGGKLRFTYLGNDKWRVKLLPNE